MADKGGNHLEHSAARLPAQVHARPADTSLPEASLTLSVIIVNYNVRDFLKQALHSAVKACEELDAEIIVVDNDSADGSSEMVASTFPDVHLIRNTENTGFSRANNQAIRISRGEFIVLLNPDTIVSEDTFSVLIDFLRSRPEAGAAGCQILHPDGRFARESRRAFPTPLVAFFRVAGLSTLFPRSKFFGRYNMSYLPADEVAEVDALSGSCMMVRRQALLRSGPSHPESVGRVEVSPRLLDEGFFMYGEDLDWCYRIQQAGWKIFYTPDTKIIHYKGESTRKGELRYVRLFYGAMVRFSRKHFTGYGKLAVEFLRVAIVFKAILSVVGRFFRTVAPAMLDFAITYCAVVLAAMLRANAGVTLPASLFLLTVAPAFSAVTVAGVAFTGGYRKNNRTIRSVAFGLVLALLVVSAASFFVKSIAFSRLVLLLTVPLAFAALAATRLHSRYRKSTISRVALVGTDEDSKKLLQTVGMNPNPSFEIVGIVPTSEDANGSRLTVLGRLDQLRDIVRVREIDTVVIAYGRMTNHALLDIIRRLRDLPVNFRMLTDTHDRVIGKASIDNLASPNMVAVDDVLGRVRSPTGKRFFDVVIAATLLLAYPVRLVAGGFRASHTHRINRQLLRVITNDILLVGARPQDTDLSELTLREGVFSIVDALPGEPDTDAIRNAYSFYLQNESTQLDWDVLMRSIRNRRKKADSGNRTGQNGLNF